MTAISKAFKLRKQLSDKTNIKALRLIKTSHQIQGFSARNLSVEELADLTSVRSGGESFPSQSFW